VKNAPRDARFSEPLYTAAEAARFLGVRPSTLSTWAKGYVRRPATRPAVHGAPIITSVQAPRNYPTIPFVGLAEGMVIAAFRSAGVSFQHIRQAVSVLEAEIGLEYALASRRLYTTGAVILYDYAAEQDDAELAGLTEVISRQRVFSRVVEDYLSRIEYDSDDWASVLASPVTPRPIVIVDPQRGFGRPMFVRGAAPVESVVGRIKAGEPIAHVAKDFGVPADDVKDYMRAAVALAA
jgi:uncharacterized protein (DUF433 family)